MEDRPVSQITDAVPAGNAVVVSCDVRPKTFAEESGDGEECVVDHFFPRAAKQQQANTRPGGLSRQAALSFPKSIRGP